MVVIGRESPKKLVFQLDIAIIVPIMLRKMDRSAFRKSKF